MGGPHRHLLVHGHSPLHALAPEVKIAAVLAFVAGVALTPRRAVWVFAVDAVVVITMLAVVGYRPRQLVSRMTVIVPFLVFAAMVPFVAGGEQVGVGGLELSREGLWAAWNTAAKTLLGFGASLVLAGTTPVPELIRGLDRLRVPATVVSIVSFMFRYLDLVVEELGRLRVAVTARGHDPRWLWQARPMASAAGALFVRSYERGERVHGAMLARGFAGRMPSLDQRPATKREWAVASIAPAVSVTAATIAAATT